MSILEIREEGTHKAAEEVVLDGNSFVASWPLEQAEALLADLTPWWMTWPTLATQETDPKVR